MSIRILLAIVVLGVSLSSCERKGCTDPNAANFDKHAKSGDPCWECEYSGSACFYFSDATRDSLVNRGVTSMNLNVEGTDMGTFPINSTVQYPMDCYASGSMSYAKPAGRSCYLSEDYDSYVIKDQNGVTLWGGGLILTPKYCSKVELTL